MKKLFFLFLLGASLIGTAQKKPSPRGIYNAPYGGPPTTIAFSRVTVYGSAMADGAYRKFPEIMVYGFLTRKTQELITQKLMIDSTSSRVVLHPPAYKVKADYIVSGAISYNEEVAFLFEIEKSGSRQRPVQLPPVYVYREDFLSGCSRLVDLIAREVARQQLASLVTQVKYGIVAEIKEGARQEDVTKLLDQFSKNPVLGRKARYIPWQTTKALSFKGLDVGLILDSLKADILVKVQVRLDGKALEIKPSIYEKELKKEIGLSTFSLILGQATFAPQLTYLQDLLEFLIPDERLLASRVQFLDDLQMLAFEEARTMGEGHMNSLLVDSTEFLKAGFLANHMIGLQRGNPGGYALLAKVRERQGRFQEAIDNWDLAVKQETMDDRKAISWIHMGGMEDSLIHYERALANFQLAKKATPRSEVAQLEMLDERIGIDQARTGNYKEAIDLLQLAMRRGTKIPEVYFWLGYANYYRGNYDDAARQFEHLLQHYQTQYPQIKQHVTDCYFEIGRSSFVKGEFDKALTALDKSLTVTETESGVLLKVATFNKLNRFAEARKLAKDKGMTYPELGRIMGQECRGLMYASKLSPVYAREAIFYFRLRLERAPQDTVTLGELGNVYAAQLKTDSAIYYLKSVVDMGSKSMGVYLDLAECYLLRDDAHAVVTQLERAPQSKGRTSNENYRMVILYFHTVARIILSEDTTPYEKPLNNFFETKDRIVTWDFTGIKQWTLKLTDEPRRKRIEDLTERMEKMVVR